MRSVPVAILVSSAFLLAGCSGDGDGDDLHYVCPGGMEIHQDDHPSANTTADLAKFCPKSSTSGSKSNSTSAAPNVLPTLVLKITDMGGNETSITLLDGNLTFDATGSTDPDGTIAGIAVTVTDSNTTRTATLYDAAKKQFKTATFNFDRPGPVNVTVAMVDDRAGFSVNQTKVYVNHVQALPSQTIQIPMGGGVADICNGGPDPLVEASWWKTYGFTLVAGASFVEAVSTGGEIAICSLPNEAGERSQLSDTTGTEVSTPPGTALPPPSGISNYIVGAFGGPNEGVAVTVTVHYEPQPAVA